MTKFEAKVLSAGMAVVGSPYIWGAKGDCRWSPTGAQPLEENGAPILAFDCSGLVTWCLKQAGWKDIRLTASAQTICDTFEPLRYGAALEAGPVIAVYGRTLTDISHVAFLTSMYGQPWALEAAGGGPTTTTVLGARLAGAAVRFGPVLRRDLQAMRRVPQPAV